MSGSDALREAAQRVVAKAEFDDDFEGQYIDYLVPADALDALRAALDVTPEPLTGFHCAGCDGHDIDNAPPLSVDQEKKP